jgi:hypothetical protein
VTLLAGGRLMYHGARHSISPWFASLGYEWLHGKEADWLLELVATGFDKPQMLLGNRLMRSDDTPAAAQAFLGHYLQVGALLLQPCCTDCCDSTVFMKLSHSRSS